MIPGQIKMALPRDCSITRSSLESSKLRPGCHAATIMFRGDIKILDSDRFRALLC